MMSRSTCARRRISAEGVVQAGGLESFDSLSARDMCTVRRRRMAMWPSAQARCVLPTPTGPRTRTPLVPSRNRRLVTHRCHYQRRGQQPP
jgi:hypothetical protein